MNIFPSLSTGAVTQYPAAYVSRQAVQVIRFIDGSDQRYPTQGQALRQWQIRLDLLNEVEIAQLEAFFVAQQGDYGTFTFPDPFSGAQVSNCMLASPGLVTQYVGTDTCSTSLMIVETVVETNE